MKTHHAAGPRFETFYEAAYSQDLLARSQLTGEQRFAVLLGGIAALPLSEERFVCEWSALLADGCTPQLAEDTLIQMATYLGYPRARQCLACLARSLADNGLPVETAGRSPRSAVPEARYEAGVSDYHRLNPDALANIEAAFGELAPNVVELTFRSFGDVYAQSAQPLALRQFATISTLGVLGCAAPQLRFHIGAGMNVGITKEQLVEIAAWVQFLAGAPAAYNAMIELKAALAAGTSATPGYQ